MEERWFDEELAGCRLGDGCLEPPPSPTGRAHGCRVRREHPAGLPGLGRHEGGLSLFFSNERVSEEEILRGHFDATQRRVAASDGPILVLHDTMEFSWRRKRPEAVGFTTTVNSGRDKTGRDRLQTVCGLLMHWSLAVTTDGLPLGMARGQVLEPQEVQGHGSPQEEGQSDARADRGQGEHALAGQPSPVHRTARPTVTLHSHRRPRGRHLGVVLPGPGTGHSLPRQALCRPGLRRWLPQGVRRHGRGEGPGTTPGRLAAPACATRQPSGHRSRRRRRDLQ